MIRELDYEATIKNFVAAVDGIMKRLPPLPGSEPLRFSGKNWEPNPAIPQQHPAQMAGNV